MNYVMEHNLLKWVANHNTTKVNSWSELFIKTNLSIITVSSRMLRLNV